MNLWLIGMLGALAGATVVWLTVRRAPSGNEAWSPQNAYITLRRPKVWRHSGVAFVVSPWLMLARVVTEPNYRDALSILAIAASLSAVGVIAFLSVRREIIFSAEGIEATKFPPIFRMNWDELIEVELHNAGDLTNIHFRDAKGRKLVVDATMSGWPELVERLPEVASGAAQEKVQRALGPLRCNSAV